MTIFQGFNAGITFIHFLCGEQNKTKNEQVLTSFLFLLLSEILTAQTGRDSFLVKPYLQFATKDGINILWETTAPATTTVEFGEALFDAKQPNLSQIKKLDGTRLLHEVKLDGLKTATKYLYRKAT